MGAPRGNQFWKLRSKHGRDKIFATPEILLEAANEYFDWVDKHPWKIKDARGKDSKIVSIPTARPYTLMALCLYLDVSENYFRDFKKGLKKEDPLTKDFSKVITCIEQTIYTQKFEGASVGAFNANIIARDLGLRDGKDITSGGDKINMNIIIENEDTEDELNKLKD